MNLVDFVAVTEPYTRRTTKRLFILFWSVNPKHLSTYTSMSVPPQQSNTSATYWYLPYMHLCIGATGFTSFGCNTSCHLWTELQTHAKQHFICIARMLAVHVLNITSAAPSCYIHHIAIQNHCFNENAECSKRSLSQSHNTHFGFCLRSFCWCSHNQALNLHRLSVTDFNS